MRPCAQIIVAGWFLVTLSASAWGYGPTGHIIVGDIAMSYLCDSARSQVAFLLGEERLGGASRWPDWIGRDPEWVKSRPWHFINVGDQKTVESALGNPEGNVLWAIGHFEDELSDTSLPLQRRSEALKFLTHFIADLHQPLHVGRAEDRGGNEIDVIVRGKRSNLHQLWDAEFLLGMEGGKLAAKVNRVSRLTRGRELEWWPSSELDWARESKEFRPQVYAFPPSADGQPVTLSLAYLVSARTISQQRLAQAGVRLGQKLNQILCIGS
jgi:hypothetical protein